MSSRTATALAHPNIAFIKYWGNRDDVLRLPANGSISMNLEELETRTRVAFDDSLSVDELSIKGENPDRSATDRVSRMLDEVRQQVLLAPSRWIAQELVKLSTHPTLVAGELQPRHVDLRAFVVLSRDPEPGAAPHAEVLPAPLTRVAPSGSMIVNSSRGGGAKDTWLVP